MLSHASQLYFVQEAAEEAAEGSQGQGSPAQQGAGSASEWGVPLQLPGGHF